MVDTEYRLRRRFKSRDDVYVGFDQLVYYSEGAKPKSVAPDVFVSFDIPDYDRDIYRIAEEGKPPDWVLEIASPSTFKYDVGGKKDLYEAMGVGEYWVYDPQGGMHDPRLRAWVLGPGGYEELADLERPGLEVALWSEVLGLEFHFDGKDLQMWDPVEGAYLLTVDGSEEERKIDRRARQVAEQRADTAEARAETAEAMLESSEASRKSTEAERDLEKRARQAAERRADAMESSMEALKAEVRRLRS